MPVIGTQRSHRWVFALSALLVCEYALALEAGLARWRTPAAALPEQPLDATPAGVSEPAGAAVAEPVQPSTASSRHARVPLAKPATPLPKTQSEPPTRVDALLEQLSSPGVDVARAQLALDWLSSMGTAPAQLALLEFARTTNTPWAAKAALERLAEQTQPSASLLKTFAATADELLQGPNAREATGAYASLVRNARTSNNDDPDLDAASRHAVRHMREAYDKSKSPDDQLRWAETMGMAGLPAAEEPLARLAASGSTDIRSRAISAMSNVTGPRADAVMRQVLSADPNAELRVRAAEVAGLRPPSPEWAESLRQALESERDPEVRYVLRMSLNQQQSRVSTDPT